MILNLLIAVIFFTIRNIIDQATNNDDMRFHTDGYREAGGFLGLFFQILSAVLLVAGLYFVLQAVK